MALLNGTLLCPVTADSVGNVWITFTIISFPVYISTLLHKYTPVVHIQISKNPFMNLFYTHKDKDEAVYFGEHNMKMLFHFYLLVCCSYY